MRVVFTGHKSQGQTYEKVVVDLKTCRGSAAPYVMLSRVKSLDGLCILRPFDKSKISCLNLQMVIDTGSPDERSLAMSEMCATFSSAQRGTLDLPLLDENDVTCLQTGNMRLDRFQRKM